MVAGSLAEVWPLAFEMAGSSARVGAVKVGGEAVAAAVVVTAVADAMSAAPAAAVSRAGIRRSTAPPIMRSGPSEQPNLDGPAARALHRSFPPRVAGIGAATSGR